MLVNHNRPFSMGFNLIELVIVMAIIIILAGISFPLVRDYLFQVRREKAKSELTYLATKMEQYYFLHHSYKNASLRELKFKSDDSYYQFKIVLANEDEYVIQAIPKAAQKHDKYGILTIETPNLGVSTP